MLNDPIEGGIQRERGDQSAGSAIHLAVRVSEFTEGETVGLVATAVVGNATRQGRPA